MAIANITDATFANDVLNVPGPVLVDFWAPWCAPCRVLHPILEELSAAMAGVTFTSLNVDENPVTAGRYQIMSIPTLIIFKGGKPVIQLIGLQSRETLREKLAAV